MKLKMQVDTNLNYIVAFILICFNLDVAICSTPTLPFQYIMYFLQVCLLVFLFRKPKQFAVKKELIVFLTFLIVLVGLFHGFNSLTYPYKLFLIILSYLIVTRVSIYKLQNAYVNVMITLAIISLFFYSLINFVGITTPFYHYISGEDGRYYATNILYTYLASWSIRNSGIFHEPGSYQIYLNIALLWYYNINKEIIFDKKSIVLLIAIFTTLSSAGIVIAACIIGIRFIQFRNIGFKEFLLLMILGIISFIGLSKFYDLIFYKVIAGVEESGSAFARYYSIFIPMEIMTDYPILGCGALEFNSVLADYKVSGMALRPGDITNTITTNFATSGFIVGLFYLWGFCRAIKKTCYTFKYKALIVVVCLVMISCENITYSLIFNYLLILGLSDSLIKNKIYD